MPKPMEIVLAGHRLTVLAHTEEQAKFWRALAPGAPGGWEDDTLRFVEARARPGVAFLDIGAWIGPLSLLAARRGARVLALEPDPVARAALEDNLARNGLHATVLPAALHADGNGLTLYGGSRGLGASRTSALGFHRGSPVEVPTVTAEEVADRAGPGPVLMKVDIEGHEYALGPVLARLRARLDASLHLSVHPRLLRRQLLRRWRLFPGRIAAARTAELLAAFGDAPVRMAGATERLTPERLRARFAAGRRGSRNFAVEIGD